MLGIYLCRTCININIIVNNKTKQVDSSHMEGCCKYMPDSKNLLKGVEYSIKKLDNAR